VWVRRDGRRHLYLQPQLDCNWLQAMENSVDSAHLMILHQGTAFGRRPPPSTTRGFTDDVESFDFYADAVGIWKKRTYKNGTVENHPLLFPNILRQGNCTQIRVPIDDTHTKIFFVRFEPTRDGSIVDDPNDPTVEYIEPYKAPGDALHPLARFRMDEVQAQDHMAWETQGPVADRTREHLAYSDRGVMMLRRLLAENIERVQHGLDPLGVIRDPDHSMIDTNLQESLDQMGERAFVASRQGSTPGYEPTTP
jgi:5,5'-dehydrodivanillate O-demethylase